MMLFNKKSVFLSVLLISSSLFAHTVYAKEADGPHKVVIQVSSNDAKAQNVALSNAVNLQKYYGIDNVVIEVVAYGPGLSLMTKKSKLSTRVKSLAAQDIRFSACKNTINMMTKKRGVKPVLTEGVDVVPSGIVRAVELQEQGYAYIRP